MVEEYTENRLLADGGTTDLHGDGRRNTVYYWFDPDSGGVLSHTGVNKDEANPFFGSVDDAERFLEQRATQDESDRYTNLSLYEARIQKVEDAVDILMDQSGIDDFR